MKRRWKRIGVFLLMSLLNLWLLACKGSAAQKQTSKVAPSASVRSIEIRWNIGDVILSGGGGDGFAASDSEGLAIIGYTQDGTVSVRSPRIGIRHIIGSALKITLPDTLETLTVRTGNAMIVICGRLPSTTHLQTNRGNVLWECGGDADFSVITDAAVRCELPVQRISGGYRCGNGSKRVVFESKGGELQIAVGS